MRVPLGNRMCMRIWPASTLGKKSRPSRNTNPQDSTQNPRKNEANSRRCSKAAVKMTV